MPSPSLGAGKLKVDNAWSQHQRAAGSQPSGAIALDPPVMKEYDRRLTLKGVGSGWAFGRLFVVLMPATSTWGMMVLFLG